jgi:putative ATPase
VDDLFSEARRQALREGAPLAARMRPRDLGEFVGQADAVGTGTPLRRAIEADELTSLILFGPAGCGKTSLARVVAGVTKARFVELSAVTSGVSDVRKVIEEARDQLGMTGRRTILFIDEIHRFSKSQQDALLPAVEDRVIVLVGATTENPLFEVNAPLLSRSRVVELTPLDDDDVRVIVRRALADDQRGLGGRVRLTPSAEDLLVTLAGGDARVALNTLEYAAATSDVSVDGVAEVDESAVAAATQTRALTYDRQGDVHYDVSSALIKSMRGSDPDAAVYWLARMVYGGEDPKYIARRILIFASEDVGNADPRALLVAHAAFKAAESVGWPECRINLAQAVLYMALAPKSNAAIRAIDAALAEVREGAARQVPDHLRDRHRPGADRYPPYRYPHSFPGARVEQQYLPDGLTDRLFYEPSDRGWEGEIQGRRAAGEDAPDSTDE